MREASLLAMFTAQIASKLASHAGARPARCGGKATARTRRTRPAGPAQSDAPTQFIQ